MRRLRILNGSDFERLLHLRTHCLGHTREDRTGSDPEVERYGRVVLQPHDCWSDSGGREELLRRRRQRSKRQVRSRRKQSGEVDGNEREHALREVLVNEPDALLGRTVVRHALVRHLREDLEPRVDDLERVAAQTRVRDLFVHIVDSRCAVRTTPETSLWYRESVRDLN